MIEHGVDRDDLADRVFVDSGRVLDLRLVIEDEYKRPQVQTKLVAMSSDG